MLIEITYNVTDVYMSTTETPIYVEISFEQPGGSAAVWGSITGTLSNQTDLQNALNAKVPYTGATGNVDLGEYELKAGQVEFDQTPTGTAGVGVMRWNDADGTVDLGLKGGNVTLQVGQEQVARVVNKTGANLLESEYKVVKVSSAQGQRLAVDLAQANNDNNSADTLGIVTENIDNNQEGFITTLGTIRGINTTGSLQGETWTDGDVLYLSGTTAGAITNVKPTAPLHIVVVGYVEYAHQNNGKIFVKVMNGWEIDELHNVLISSPTDNQGLFYNSTSTLWENKSITTALGYTPVPTTRNITINGVTYDLSADRTWTIAAGISGSGASGQVTYWTGASAVSGSNNLFWDNTNGRLGIGTNAPASRLSVTNIIAGEFISTFRASGTPNPSINIEDGDITIPNYSSFGFNPTLTSNTIAFLGSVGGAIGGLSFSSFSNSSDERALLFSGFSGRITATANPVVTFRAAKHDGGTNATTLSANDIAFQFNNFSSPLVRVMGSGNFIINNTTDSTAHKLQVYGDTLLRGSGTTSATTALTVQNSSSSNLLRILNDGTHKIGGQNIDIYPSANGSTISNGGRGLIISTNASSQTDAGALKIIGGYSSALGSDYGIWVSHSFTNGTGGVAIHNGILLNQTINQTGGANGITRGLYVNPTLTAAADFRAIETSAGNVLFGASGTGFFWDNANSRLGIGTNTPTNSINIVNGRLDISGTSSVSGSGISMGYLTGTYAWIQSWVSRPIALNPSGNNVTIGVSGGADNGQRLQVYGDTLLRGSGATSATTALRVQNSAGSSALTVDNGLTTIVHGDLQLVNTVVYWNGGNQIRNTSNGVLRICDSTGADFTRLQFGGTSTSFPALQRSGASICVMDATGAAGANLGVGTTTINASAILQADSTTKGFLPPRMTTTQKNAISTPAAGLVVYDTTLNKLCVYTTAWETVTSI